MKVKKHYSFEAKEPFSTSALIKINGVTGQLYGMKQEGDYDQHISGYVEVPDGASFSVVVKDEQPKNPQYSRRFGLFNGKKLQLTDHAKNSDFYHKRKNSAQRKFCFDGKSTKNTTVKEFPKINFATDGKESKLELCFWRVVEDAATGNVPPEPDDDDDNDTGVIIQNQDPLLQGTIAQVCKKAAEAETKFEDDAIWVTAIRKKEIATPYCTFTFKCRDPERLKELKVMKALPRTPTPEASDSETSGNESDKEEEIIEGLVIKVMNDLKRTNTTVKSLKEEFEKMKASRKRKGEAAGAKEKSPAKKVDKGKGKALDQGSI